MPAMLENSRCSAVSSAGAVVIRMSRGVLAPFPSG